METYKEKANDPADYYGGMMMDNEVSKCTEKLIRTIQESEDYKKFLTYEEELNRQPELRRRVDEFRSKNFRLQKQEGIDLFVAVDQLEREYAELRSDAFVNAYLEAELTMCRMLQEIHTELMEKIPISIPDEL